MEKKETMVGSNNDLFVSAPHYIRSTGILAPVVTTPHQNSVLGFQTNSEVSPKPAMLPLSDDSYPLSTTYLTHDLLKEASAFEFFIERLFFSGSLVPLDVVPRSSTIRVTTEHFIVLEAKKTRVVEIPFKAIVGLGPTYCALDRALLVPTKAGDLTLRPVPSIAGDIVRWQWEAFRRRPLPQAQAQTPHRVILTPQVVFAPVGASNQITPREMIPTTPRNIITKGLLSPVEYQMTPGPHNFVGTTNDSTSLDIPWLSKHLSLPPYSPTSPKVITCRLSSLRPGVPLFEEGPPDLRDVDPGLLSCGAAIIVILRTLFVYNTHHVRGQFSEGQEYRVRFHLDGSWRHVTLDDTVPVIQESEGRLIPILPMLTTSLWLPLLVKAMATYYGGYAQLETCYTAAQICCDLSGGVHMRTLPSSTDVSVVSRQLASRSIVLTTAKSKETSCVIEGNEMSVRVVGLHGTSWLDSEEYASTVLRTDVVSLFSTWNEATIAGTLTPTTSVARYGLSIDTASSDVVLCLQRRDARFTPDNGGCQFLSLLVASCAGNYSSSQDTGTPGHPVLLSANLSQGIHTIEVATPRDPLDFTLRVLCAEPFALVPILA